MSHIDVHEIKLNLRYPNSRQEDITDAFMRGYQGAVKIGNDAVRRVKAEKETLIRRIDELCQENERLRQENARLDELLPENERWFSFDVVKSLNDERDQLAAENIKLREFAAHMANALGIDSEWCDTSWCDTDCMVEFGCQTSYCGGETRCPAWARMQALGIEVDGCMESNTM